MNAHEQANIGGPLTAGSSGQGALNGAPSTSFFVSFATAGTLSGILAGDVTNSGAGTVIDIPSGSLVAGIIHPVAFRRVTAFSGTGLMWWS